MSVSRPAEPPIQVETVVVSVRRHGRVLTLPVVVMLALAAASGYWVGRLPEAWMNLAVGAGAAVLGVLLGIGPVLSWMTRRVVITNRRVILRHGVFVQHRAEVPLARVREVRSRRTLVQRLWGSGNIELVGGVEGSTVLRDLAGYQVIADALQELLEQNFARPESFFTSTSTSTSTSTRIGMHPDDTITLPR